MKTFISAPNHDQALEVSRRYGIEEWWYAGPVENSAIVGLHDFHLIRYGPEIPTWLALRVHHARASGGTVIIEEVRL